VTSGLPRRIGIEYPVVVRSLDRLNATPRAATWRRKWSWLMEHGNRPRPDAVHWIRPGEEGSAERLMARLVIDDVPVCLMLPRGLHDQYGRDDEIAAGLSAGLPIIVWCRDGEARPDFEDVMTSLVETTALTGLPDEVLRLRRYAVSRDDPLHVGMHIGLLWDDPGRLPEPEAFMRAPETGWPAGGTEPA
jgi:vWA-MoxR associated protein C-terminal domain